MEISVENKQLSQQRMNYAKLQAILAFLATTPKEKIAGEDIAQMSQEAGAALTSMQENPGVIAVHKTAEAMGVFNEAGELTSKGMAIAQTCLNARPGSRYKVNYEEFFRNQALGGLFAAQKALADELKSRIEHFQEQDGFKAEGQTAKLFEEVGEFYMGLAGIELE